MVRTKSFILRSYDWLKSAAYLAARRKETLGEDHFSVMDLGERVHRRLSSLQVASVQPKTDCPKLESVVTEG